MFAASRSVKLSHIPVHVLVHVPAFAKVDIRVRRTSTAPLWTCTKGAHDFAVNVSRPAIGQIIPRIRFRSRTRTRFHPRETGFRARSSASAWPRLAREGLFLCSQHLGREFCTGLKYLESHHIPGPIRRQSEGSDSDLLPKSFRSLRQYSVQWIEKPESIDLALADPAPSGTGTHRRPKPQSPKRRGKHPVFRGRVPFLSLVCGERVPFCCECVQPRDRWRSTRCI